MCIRDRKKTAPAAELNDNEKAVMAILSKKGKMDLNELKTQANLSNKAWDKAVKALRAHNLISIEKNDDDLTIQTH